MMGNYRFRLSDMMPNAWFYKLTNMSTTTKSRTKPLPLPSTSHPRRHYYSHHPIEAPPADTFHKNSPINPKVSDTHFPDHHHHLPPTKSSPSKKKKPKAKTTIPNNKPPSSSTCHQYTSSGTDFHGSSPFSSSCSCRLSSSINSTDIIIDMDDKSFSTTSKFDRVLGFDSITDLKLPPILTKPPNPKALESIEPKISPKQYEIGANSIKIVREDTIHRKSSSNSTGMKLRSNSPKLASKKIQGSHGRKSSTCSAVKPRRRRGRRNYYPESFAMVKSSFDPEKDFRDSMMEMVVENGIRGRKELEELLACYLSLNSDEYHGAIVKAFEQIWFHITEIQIVN